MPVGGCNAGCETQIALRPSDAESRRGKGTQSQKNGWNWFRNLKVFPDAIGTIPIGEALARKIVHPHLPAFPLFLDSLCDSLRLGDFASTKKVRRAPCNARSFGFRMLFPQIAGFAITPALCELPVRSRSSRFRCESRERSERARRHPSEWPCEFVASRAGKGFPMQKSSMWKLGALAGVVALGFFAVYQTQRGLQDESPTEGGSAAAAPDLNAGGEHPPGSVADGRVRLAQREPKTAPLGNPFADDGERQGASTTSTFPPMSDTGQQFRGDGARFNRGNGGAAAGPSLSSGASGQPTGKMDNPFRSDEVEDGFKSKTAKTGPTDHNPFLKNDRETVTAGAAKSDPAKSIFGDPIERNRPGAKIGDDSPRNVFGAKLENPGAATNGGDKSGNASATPADNPFESSDKKDSQGNAAKAAPATKSDVSGSSTPMNPFGTLPDDNTDQKQPAASSGPSFSGASDKPMKRADAAATPAGKTATADNPFGTAAATKTKSNPDADKAKRSTDKPASKENPFAKSGDISDDDRPKPAAKQGNPFKASSKPAPNTAGHDVGEAPKSLYAPSPKKDSHGEPRKDASDNTTPFPDGSKKDDSASPKVAQPKTNSPERSGNPPRLMPVPSAKQTKTADLEASPKTTVTRTPGNPAPAASGETPQPTPQVTIHKTAPRSAVLGRPFVYDILIKNVGGSTARSVVVQDPIPSGVRLEGTDPQAYLSRNNLVWKLGSLAAGESRKISVKVTPVRAGQIGSVATVNFVAQTAAKPAVARPKLVFHMQGPKQAKLGEKVTFRFTVTNVGTADAKEIWLRDLIPDGLKHPAGDDLEYKIGSLSAGKSESISLAMTVAKAGQLTNRALITASGGVRLEARSAVSVVAPKLVISRTGPSLRTIGRQAVYQNMITNGSTQTVMKATLVESVPAGMGFIAASNGGKYDAVRRTVAWMLGPIAPGQSKTVQLKLLPKQAGVQNSIVQAIGSDGSTVRTASATKVVGYAALAVDVPGLDRPVNIGEQVTLRIVARNRGTAPSSNVKLKVTLPSQLSLVSIRGGGKYTVSGGVISFDAIDKLAGQNRVNYDLTVKAVTQGDSRVKVQIQSDGMSKPLHREEAVLVLPSSQ
jgi:uncharacterized repeat protein (TIGR01451 family)